MSDEEALAIPKSETLEDFFLIVETRLSETLQAEISTIKGDIAELKQFVQEVREFAATMRDLAENHPMGSMLMNSGAGGGFGFQ